MVARETSIRLGLRALGLDERAASRLARFHDLLLEVALPLGFLGPHEAPRLVERHILESAALVTLLPEGPFVDVGTGAGLPGVVLACLHGGPGVLVEAEGRKAGFLERVIAELGLEARVVRARAEDAGHEPDLRESLQAAVARALAPPPVALELTLPFVLRGGRAILSVGPSVEMEPAARAAEVLGGGRPQVVPLRVPGLPEDRRAMIVPKVGVCPGRYPRRAGVPARRPLGGA